MIAVIESGVRLKRKPAIAIRTPFSEQFGERLKRAVPKDEREFKFETGSWVVLEKRRAAIEKLVLQFFGSFMHRGGPRDGFVVERNGITAKQESLAL